MTFKINYKRVFFWVTIMTFVNLGLFFLIHNTLEKNQKIFTQKDIELTHHIVSFVKDNKSDVLYNLKLQSYLLKQNPDYAKLMINGLILDNYNDGRVFFYRDLKYQDLPYDNFSLSFSNIPNSTCAFFATSFLDLAHKININGSDIKGLNKPQHTDAELQDLCTASSNIVSFNFPFK